jgi:ubiquinone/menaquinone biosynthesis C-methylase UbiE
MDKYQETSETWNKMATLYENKFMHVDIYNKSYDAILDALPNKNAKILEIGCGPGNIAHYLLAKRPDLDFFGTDIAPNMVELAQKNNPQARFAVLDIREINQLNSKYDGIICGFCLPYLTQADGFQFLAQCSRLLEKNGVLYISFVEGEPKDSGFKTNNTGDRVFFNYYKLEDLKKELSTCGLKDITVLYADFPRGEGVVEKHTMLLALKSS